MEKGRLEAFTDGAIAVVITMMVLQVVACVLLAAVAAIWFVPDRRIEQRLGGGQSSGEIRFSTNDLANDVTNGTPQTTKG